MFHFSKEKYVCIFANRAKGERLILAMLSYRFVQAKPKPTENTGLNCRSTSKLAILAPETSGLPVLLMKCVTHAQEKPLANNNSWTTDTFSEFACSQHLHASIGRVLSSYPRVNPRWTDKKNRILERNPVSVTWIRTKRRFLQLISNNVAAISLLSLASWHALSIAVDRYHRYVQIAKK